MFSSKFCLEHNLPLNLELRAPIELITSLPDASLQWPSYEVGATDQANYFCSGWLSGAVVRIIPPTISSRSYSPLVVTNIMIED